MPEVLLTCPVCAQPGFLLRGLKVHRCPRKPNEKGQRQQLTRKEIEAAMIAAQYPQNPL